MTKAKLIVDDLRTRRFIAVFVSMFFLIPAWVLAEVSPKYQVPPKPLADLVDAPSTPSVQVDPNHEWLLILDRKRLTTIKEMAQPELRIGGLRINPRTNGPSRSRFIFRGMKLQKISGGMEMKISGLPDRASIRNVSWSPDGKSIAFVNVDGNGQSLWIVDLKAARARKLVSGRMNSAYGVPYYWLSDNSTLICKMVPKDHGLPPAAPQVPTGPVVQVATGKKAPARTYQDLLTNAHDEALFEYYLEVELYRVTVEGQSTKLGKSGMIKRAEPSPDGRFLLVETLHRPFSYLVPARRFPTKVEICDLNGMTVKQIADLPLAEEVPIGRGAVPTGRRSFDWRADAEATLYWAEAQDDGNPRKKSAVRDEIFTLAAPFTSHPESLIELPLRYSQIRWAESNLALVESWWWQNRKIQTWMIRPDASNSKPQILFDYSWQDRYNDPGEPLMKRSATGHEVLLTDKKGTKLYLTGDGASPEGDRPFLDELQLADKTTKRLWRSEAPHYETAVQLLDPNKLTVLTRRESTKAPPNYFVRNLKNDKISQITKFPHPTPQLANIQKELIRYKREDGVELTATLYLPAGYKAEDGPLPMLMWAYPREFKSAKAASQVKGSPYRFTAVSPTSSRVWLAMGYALLDGPTMPIIGEGDSEPNDTYIQQLVASAKAAVDEVVRRGVADRDRIAIGGHSYGAFMVANLLAHSDLFATGIARSGAYNRTLTPFGFQAEERTYWQAPEIYYAMSPFMHADKVNEPILLIHGEADNNSGTFPIQSKRFYHALKGNGAKARLVMLPHESHGYRSQESILHMLWETNRWLEKYVKNAKTVREKTDTSMR